MNAHYFQNLGLLKLKEETYIFGDITMSQNTSRSSLEAGESALQLLAKHTSGLSSDNKRLQNKLSNLVDLLKRDEQKKRAEIEQTRNSISFKIKNLNSKNNQLQSKKHELLAEFLPERYKTDLSYQTALQWKSQHDSELKATISSIGSSLSRLYAKIDVSSVKLGELRNSLEQQEQQLLHLIHEDKKLSSPSKLKILNKEFKGIQIAVIEAQKKGADICQIKNLKRFQIVNEIKTIEKYLEQINSRVGLIDDGFTKLDSKATNALTKRKKKKSENGVLREIEELIDQVKRNVSSEQKKLSQLLSINESINDLQRQEENKKKAIDNEKKRIERQVSRTKLIKNTKEEVSRKKDEIKKLEAMLEMTEIQIDDLNEKQSALKDEQKTKSHLFNKIEQIHKEIESNYPPIRELENVLASKPESDEIWKKCIITRIKKARKQIGLIHPAVFIPFELGTRMALNHLIRKELIIAERRLHQFGLLDEAYFENTDIFNRKLKDGKQLSLDILAF